jgi:pyrroline-5-carboxylate reductase
MARPTKIGVIGCGQMGEALLRGILASGVASPGALIGSDKDRARLDRLASELGFIAARDNSSLAGEAQVVILAVKPADISQVLEEIGAALRPDQTLVSIAAGVRLDSIRKKLGPARLPLIRVMPNTPCLVGAGMSALAPAPGVPREATEQVQAIFASVGETLLVEEELMDAVTGLSGSGPAYVFLVIEALADGGVAAGLPRAAAEKLAAQTVLGAAKLVLESGRHPASLKDAVASPGGTTIAGLAALEEAGLRAALIKAVVVAAARSRQLGEAK